ncbi:TraR/DksA C4-type zinc finger protein [Chelativorans salis]|uniref:TraR/DksA C4-type zinc finger protein n=1 Tax=Chelativorans salis TaxID=2978478 RepID=UPI003CC56DC0
MPKNAPNSKSFPASPKRPASPWNSTSSGEEIPDRRLQIDPMAERCVGCAGGR